MLYSCFALQICRGQMDECLADGSAAQIYDHLHNTPND